MRCGAITNSPGAAAEPRLPALVLTGDGQKSTAHAGHLAAHAGHLAAIIDRQPKTAR